MDPTSLPIYEIADAVANALKKSPRLIVEAPTGSGKSTQVPQILLDRGVLGDGEVVVLQPRRIAARMLARRVAEERMVELGSEVGYQVRLESRVSNATRIRYVTEGVLLRRLLSDPLLDGVSAIIFDEFHERHVYGDISLARAMHLQASLRDDLKLVVMSATLDSDLLAKYLAPCEHVISEGRTFPVDVSYLPKTVDFRKRPVWDVAAQALDRAVRDGAEGDVLIFMPGSYEIFKTIDAIRNLSTGRQFTLLPLHGELPPREQDAALEVTSKRKVVVATNVAETSITIDGVRVVVDSGLARVAKYDPHRGINTLHIDKISQASTDQRKGRAGRTAPGHCVRLWTEAEQSHRPLQQTPEIHRVDLAEVVLSLKAGGIEDLHAFSWVERPDETSLTRAITLLKDLGALDHNETLTTIGQRMITFPIHPRYARMLLAADELGCVRQAALVAALTQGRSILTRRPGKTMKGEREDFLGDEANSDFQVLMRAWSYAKQNNYHPGKCQRLGIHGQSARTVTQLYERFLGMAERQGLTINERAPDDEILQRCILLGFSDHLAKRRNKATLRCQLVHGRRGELSKDSVARNGELLVAADISEIEHGGTRDMQVLLNLATCVEEAWLQEYFPDDFNEESSVMYDSTAKRVVGVKRRRFRDLVLDEKVTNEVNPDLAAPLLAQEVVKGELVVKKWNADVEKWITRVNCLSAWCPELAIPKIDEEGRLTILEHVCAGALSKKDVKERDVWPALKSWLDATQLASLDKLVPERIALPSGRKAKIRYEENKAPVLSATIQDLYDLKQSPRIAMNKITLTIEALGPNRRPVQITEDLASFWENTYPQIKSELARKYPKHEWR